MKNIFIHIKRYNGDDNHTNGVCTLFGTDLENDLITSESIISNPFNSSFIPLFSAQSLERGWLDNEPNKSCVPVGEYHCVYEYSDSFNKKLWELYGVEGRSECKFHSANYWHQLNGCIALGVERLFLDSDKQYDVSRSVETMQRFDDVLRPMRGKIVKLIIE